MDNAQTLNQLFTGGKMENTRTSNRNFGMMAWGAIFVWWGITELFSLPSGMDVIGFGRMAAVQDPTGAYLFFWKPLRSDDSMAYGGPGRLSWNDLTTRNPEAAVDFYAKLLDWDIQPMTGLEQPYWQVSIDGEGEGGIMPMPEMVPAEVPAFWMPYFGTTDVVAGVAKAKELGATVQAEPTQVGDMLVFAVLMDPAGATFALLQPIGAPGM